MKTLYFDESRKEGEIGGRAVIEGLKGIGHKIKLSNESYVPLPNGKKLKRSIMPPNYNIYKGFKPEYHEYDLGLNVAIALTTAMRGNKKLTLENLRQLAPQLSSNKLQALLPLVGTRASNANIYRVMKGIENDIFDSNMFNPESPINRSWTRNNK